MITFLFLFSSSSLAAEIVINEFAAVTDGTTENPDWVELYNLSDKEIDLNGWIIRDNTETNKIILTGFICPKSFRKFNFANRLNNDGDSIRLFDKDGNLVDSVTYFSSEIPLHPKGSSTGRLPDGSSQWVVFSNPTPSDNECLISTPSSTPTLALSVTPSITVSFTPTSFPKAFYKINEVKNKNGETISNVKIYVDGVYIHHYAPEVLTFCEGCKCDTYVDCGFGSHLIELQKTGYQSWSERIEIKAGDNLEVNPIMEKENVSYSSPTSLPTATPTFIPLISLPPNSPTPTFKIHPSETATKEGEILGESQPATSAFYPWESTEEGEMVFPSPETPKNKKWIGILFIGGGFLLLFGGGVYFWYTQIKGQKSNGKSQN